MGEILVQVSDFWHLFECLVRLSGGATDYEFICVVAWLIYIYANLFLCQHV